MAHRATYNGFLWGGRIGTFAGAAYGVNAGVGALFPDAALDFAAHSPDIVSGLAHIAPLAALYLAVRDPIKKRWGLAPKRTSIALALAVGSYLLAHYAGPDSAIANSFLSAPLQVASIPSAALGGAGGGAFLGAWLGAFGGLIGDSTKEALAHPVRNDTTARDTPLLPIFFH